MVKSGNSSQKKTEVLHVKNMVCNCCVRIIRIEFEKAGIDIERISLGVIVVNYFPQLMSIEKIAKLLKENGFELILDRERKIVEQIKLAVIELVHHLNNVDSIVRKSEYLVEKLGMSYQHLSKLFSKYETITLEKYIILNKIEKIKEMIDCEDYTLSEIAYMMDYSSVQYLSNQFKKIAGMSVSDYKKSDKAIKRSLTDLCDE